MGLESSMLSETSQTGDNKYCYYVIWGIQTKQKLTGTGNRLVVISDRSSEWKWQYERKWSKGINF